MKAVKDALGYLEDDWGCLSSIAFFIPLVAIVATIALVAMAGTWHADHVECLRLHEQTGYPTRMAGNMFSGGCFIQINGRWIPDERYRSVDVDGG